MSAIPKSVSVVKEVVCQNFVNGKFCASKGKFLDVLSPYSGAVIGSVPLSSEAEVDEAIKFSSEAFKAWSRKTFKERSQYLFKYREILLNRIDEVADVAAAESGKTFAEAKAEVNKGIEVVEYALSLQNKVHNVGVLEVSSGVECKEVRMPMGVTVGITPFNFPAMVPMWLYPISLACGNTFIWKPSEKVPLTAQILSEIMNDAGFPAGVFQTINGAKEVVDRLVSSSETKVISFVGSSKVAKDVYIKSSTEGKRSLCLGGAKNHIILCEDAEPEITIQGIVDSFTGCAGQRCMAASVLLAVGNVEDLISKITNRAKDVELGSSMGAIIDEASLNRIKNIIETAKKEGAKIILDGTKAQAPKGMEGGFWIGPTIIDGATEDMECVKTEIFGPVLTICRVKTLEEAIQRENRHSYGNATSVFTTSGAVAEYVSKFSSNGMIGINIGVPVPREPFSFGGTKDSKYGQGDITGDASLDLWTNIKKITTKWQKIDKIDWMS